MNQICDGYNPRVRMGNWFQESYSVPQPTRTNPLKQLRDAEIDIGYIDAHLKLKPLNRIARLPPWNTSGLVEAPQYQSMLNRTVTKQNYDIGVNHHFFNKWNPRVYEKNGESGTIGQNSIKINQFKKQYRMFDEKNVNQLINGRDADISSFKSSLIPEKHVQQKDLLKSVYQLDISQKNQKCQKNSNLINEAKSHLQKPEFRRIRSEITLKNVPLIKTYK